MSHSASGSDLSVASSSQPRHHDNAAGFIRPHQTRQKALVRLIDSCIILLSLWLVVSLLKTQWPQRYEWNTLYLNYGITALLCFQFFAEYNEIYSSWRNNRFFSLLFRLLGAWALTIFTMVSLFFLLHHADQVSRIVIVSWAFFSALLLIIFHAAYFYMVRVARPAERHMLSMAVVGANNMGVRLVNTLTSMPASGYRFKGYYDDRQVKPGRCSEGTDKQLLGNLDNLYNDARAGKIDTIFVTLPMAAEKRVKKILDKLGDTTATVFYVPDLFAFNLINSRCVMIQGLPCFSVYGSPFEQDPLDGMVKRLEDVVLSSIILALILVPMFFIAVGVKLSSPGPVIFRQKRYGADGSEIEVWKFRTMTVCENGPDVKQATKNDPRIKPYGAFLRKYSLDELPQFINVLQGRMSIVGPRPHAVSHNEQYRKEIDRYMLRHKVKPGITGLAQVNGCRGETDTLDKMERRVAYDLQYIQNWSLLLDLKIIFLTVFQVFRDPNAY